MVRKNKDDVDVALHIPKWMATAFLAGLISISVAVAAWAIDINGKVNDLDGANIDKRLQVLERQNELLQQQSHFTTQSVQRIEREQKEYRKETNKKLDYLIQRSAR